MKIGEFEVMVIDIMILNIVKIMLFIIEDDNNVNDELCMKYCYLDLCCLLMINNIKLCY